MTVDDTKSWAMAGLLCRCPHCIKGPLFEGFLGVRARCPECGLDYGKVDTGDGPAFFIVLIAGFVVVFAALFVEIAYQPSYWVHAALWGPLALVLSLGLLRPFKAILIALQYKNDAAVGRLAGDDASGDVSDDRS